MSGLLWDRLLVSSGAALLAALVSCKSATPPVSNWPPEDYYVEVRYQKDELDQRVRV